MLYLLSANAFGGTCTTISRTNFSANQILTSSDLNSQLNNIYAPFNSAAGAADGGCIADGTLEFAAVNATDWAVPLNALGQGCLVTRSDAATLSVDKCWIAIDGAWTATAAATTKTWGGVGDASELSSTVYYLYAETASTSTTLDLLISTSAPDARGYSGTSRILARFYNNHDSDIDQYSIDQWSVNGFIPQETGWIDGGVIPVGGTTTAPTKATTMIYDKFLWKRQGQDIIVHAGQQYTDNTGVAAGSGAYLYQLIPTTVRFATGAATNDWSTGGSSPSTFGSDLYTSVGPMWFHDYGTPQRGEGWSQIYNATSVRSFLTTNSSATEYMCGSTGLCLFDTTDKAFTWLIRARIQGWGK